MADHARVAILCMAIAGCATAQHPGVHQGARCASVTAATLEEPDVATPNISTEEMERIIASGTAVVLDARPRLEWAVSHIPTALNVGATIGTSLSEYVSDVAEIERLTNGDRQKPLVLYCNGPHCGKSKRLASELIAAGFTSVRRYQLGAPVWRALGRPMVVEAEAVPYILHRDRTAVVIDARDPAEFSLGSVATAVNIPRSLVAARKGAGELKAAKDDGRLPMHDHNTRIIVVGRNGQQARELAEAISREAFHNVVFFDGTYAHFALAARPQVENASGH